MKPKLEKYDTIVAAIPESCSGPGWSNQLIWLYIRDGNGKYRMAALQPEDQTPEMYLMFRTLEAAHGVMLAEVQRALNKVERNAKSARG